MNDIYLTPTDGMVVRDPVTGLALPEQGAAKSPTSYWLRRLRDGDVREGTPPKAAAAPSATATTAKGDAK